MSELTMLLIAMPLSLLVVIVGFSVWYDFVEKPRLDKKRRVP
jgi:hypothetical protein